MPHAIIIGAGIAGTSAAEYLTSIGWAVTVLDKADRPGGRCATRQVAAEPMSAWFDYGAQYFTTRDPAFREVVDCDLASNRLVHWQPDICVAERIDNRWRCTPSPDDRERLIAPTGLNDWARHRLAACNADVRCETKVTSLRHSPQRWQILTEQQRGPLAADIVIVTTPAVQTAALLGDEARNMSVLENATQAMRACHALIVAAPGRAGCHGLFVKNGALSWAGDNSHKSGNTNHSRHLWTLHAAPGFSDDHVNTPTDHVAPALTDEFSRITGIDPKEILPVHSHRWRYARPSAAASQPDGACQVDPARRIALAGDWLAGGRVEGAWRSGRAAAAGLAGAGGKA